MTTADPTAVIDPYPEPTPFPDDWSHETLDWYLSLDWACSCEDGFLPTCDGGAVECPACGERVEH